MLSKKICINIYVNLLSEWLTQKEIVYFDRSICNFYEREYLMKFIYPVVNVKILKIKQNSKNILFFQNRQIKYYCIHFNFSDNLFNIFQELQKNENITKLIIENCIVDITNLFEKYPNIDSLSLKLCSYIDYFKNNSQKIIELSIFKKSIINPLFFECQMVNLIIFSATIDKFNETKLIDFLKKCNFLEQISIYFTYTECIKSEESKLLKFLITNECPPLTKIKIHNAFIECKDSIDAENFLVNLSLKHYQLTYLEFCEFSMINFDEKSIKFISEIGSLLIDEREYVHKKKKILNYKTLGDIDMILKMLKNLKNLKHFGISHNPYDYLQQIIKCTNIRTLRFNSCFIDYETMIYRRTNKFFG